MRSLVISLLAVAALIGCVAQPGQGIHASGSPTGFNRPSTAPATETASQTASATPSPSIQATVRPHVPSTCHLTKPDHPFVPPAGYPAPAQPPGDNAWYGSERLWTMLRRGGDIWDGLPHGPNGFSNKSFWWSADFDVNQELQPALSIAGRRLDQPGHFVSPGPGTNAQADFGSAMLTGIDIPAAGCWQITATYRYASLSFVAWVGK